jgi:hypothetical protein
MRILSLRRQAGKGGKGAWVRNEDTGEFERYARYGKITRDTITVAAEEESK